MIGESPLNKGVLGEISKYAMKHLEGTFETFGGIKQANIDKDETLGKIWLVL